MGSVHLTSANRAKSVSLECISALCSIAYAANCTCNWPRTQLSTTPRCTPTTPISLDSPKSGGPTPSVIDDCSVISYLVGRFKFAGHDDGGQRRMLSTFVLSAFPRAAASQ